MKMNDLSEKGKHLSSHVHSVHSSIFIFGVYNEDKAVMEMLEYAQDTKYDSYILIDDCYILQEKSTKFICICKKCNKDKAKAIIIFEEENNNHTDYVQILTCGQDFKSLDEQDPMLLKVLIMKINTH